MNYVDAVNENSLENDRDRLEAMVDNHDIRIVAEMLSHICFEKADLRLIQNNNFCLKATRLLKSYQKDQSFSRQ